MPHEFMTYFSYKIQKTWDRILVTVNPSLGNAFLHYIRDFNRDVATTLQTLGGDTILVVYDFSIRGENNLIQGGKLAPRPLMPLFLDMSVTHQPMVDPIPSTNTNQPHITTPPTSTSSNELEKLKFLMQNIFQTIDRKF